MSLEIHLDETLTHLLSSKASESVSAKQLIQCIDLTLLDEQASFDSLDRLKSQANAHAVAAVCVHTCHLRYFNPTDQYKLATVVNFPQGNEDLDLSLKQIELAKSLGATEIDYVLPYQSYLTGNQQIALDYCKAISDFCRRTHLTLKIILETGAFPDMSQIYTVSKELVTIGCDFLKTSTGKIPQGASLSAVFAMLSAIKELQSNCGIKVSGGIKTPQQARNYALIAEHVVGKEIDSNWFRIGASSLLNELI